jgi:hypothetical protein
MISLCVPDEKSCREEDRHDQHDPHVPSPSSSLCNEASANRPQDRAEENAHGIYSDGFAALRRNEEIRDDAGADGYACAAAHAGEEAHPDQAAEVWRKRAAEREGAEEDIADV